MDRLKHLVASLGQFAIAALVLAAPIPLAWWSAENDDEKTWLQEKDSMSISRALLTSDFDECHEASAVLADGAQVTVYGQPHMPRSVRGRDVVVSYSDERDGWEVDSSELRHPWRMGFGGPGRGNPQLRGDPRWGGRRAEQGRDARVEYPSPPGVYRARS